MKTRLFAALLSVALASSAAGAAEIHGTLSEAGKPVAGSVLTLDCGGTTASVKTDEFGSYSLKVAVAGECRLSLERAGSSLALRVTVYEKPSRYDLEVATEAGKPVLRRK